jgi:hypothetical protein
MPTCLRTCLDGLDVVGQFHSVHHQTAFLVLFQAVDAADQRALAGAGGAADDDALALGDRKVNVAQHVEVVAVPLVDVVKLMMGASALVTVSGSVGQLDYAAS